MAKVKLGPMVAGASGSVGGAVFSRNRYGSYVRQRVSPVNPNTPPQNDIRAAMTAISQAWRDVLTPEERLAWTQYAANTPVTDIFGDNQIISGNAMYCAFNNHWTRAGKTRVDVAPTTPGTTSAITLTHTATALAGWIITATNPSIVVGDFCSLVIASAPLTPSRNYYGGPFTFNAMFALADLPVTVLDIGEVFEGQRWFCRTRYFSADGRRGPVWQGLVDVIAGGP